MTSAIAYLRTSSRTNVGEDKDSDKRQREAINNYAQSHELEVVQEFYDVAVKGADPVADRPAFAAMLGYMQDNAVKVVLVENAGRFARDLVVQLTGHAYLQSLGIALIPVDAPDYFTDETPTATMVRQILGAVAQFEKTSLVEKMRKARDRKRLTTGRCEGRKPVPEGAVLLARALRSEGRTLRDIAGKLREQGYDAPSGKAYGPGSVAQMVDRARKLPDINELIKAINQGAVAVCECESCLAERQAGLANTKH